MKRKILVTLLICLVIMICGCNNSHENMAPIDNSDPIDNSNPKEESNPRDNIMWTLKYSEGKFLPQEVEECLKDFLLDAYYYMATWDKDTDLKDNFAGDCQENAFVCQNAYELLVDMRSARDVDLTFECKEVKVDVLNVAVENDTYVINLKEGYTCRFPFMEEDSITQGIECRMGIKESDGKYKLTFYERIEDFYKLIQKEYNYGSANPQEDISNIRAKVMDALKKQIKVFNSQKAEVISDGYTAKTKTCDVSIDRKATKEYALKYALERNSQWFAYDSLGGNCQNFGSQVINAGGVPMDIWGGAIWKHYSTGVNLNNVAEGRTPSWTGVPQFYTYAGSNTGPGLVAEVDTNIYTAEAGDILQVGNLEGSFTHTIVALDPIIDQNGKVIDINTVSNTVDRKNYPLSAYNYPNVRLIKVYGYNK